VIERQHIWVGPDATSFEEACEVCLSLSVRELEEGDTYFVQGTLRRDADVGFTSCRRGHRIVVHRVARALARAS
jgi:hypothetical protein